MDLVQGLIHTLASKISHASAGNTVLMRDRRTRGALRVNQTVIGLVMLLMEGVSLGSKFADDGGGTRLSRRCLLMFLLRSIQGGECSGPVLSHEVMCCDACLA